METEELVRIDEGILKRLARMYETGASINEIAEQLRMTIRTTRRLLKLLGYALE